MPPRAIVQPAATAASPSELLERLAAEMRRLSARLLNLEGAICALASDPTATRMSHEELQSFDLIIQTTTALGGFLSHLALDGPTDGGIELAPALSRLPLADLRDRLAGATAPDRSAEAAWEWL